MITIVAPSRYKIGKRAMKKQIQAIAMKYGIDEKIGVNIVFVGKRKMKAVASTYKHENVALPVLSFKFDEVSPEQEALLGEIIICYPQIVLLAAEREKTINDTIMAMIEHGIQNLLK